MEMTWHSDLGSGPTYIGARKYSTQKKDLGSSEFLVT